MSKQETQKILIVIESLYPNFRISNRAETLQAWAWALNEYEYTDVNKALNIYIKTNNTNFAPSVNQIIALINTESDLSYPTESEAWAMVRKAIQCLDFFNPQKEYDKLPTIVKKAVVNPATLVEIAKSDIESFESVEGSNFKRVYRGIVEREKTEQRMPADVRERIEAMRSKNIMHIEAGQEKLLLGKEQR